MYETILQQLEAERNPDALAGMAQYGITPDHAYGIKIPVLRQLARKVRGNDKAANHALAQQLWANNTRETRILASMVDVPQLVSEAQMESWAAEFDYWEICDQCCMNLFEKTPFAYQKAVEWGERAEEYVKRAGFVLMARLAVSDKKAADERFTAFLPLIEKEAGDARDMVKKSVNWALRQIGKRNLTLNQQAIAVSERIQQQESKAAQWVARDALKELTGTAVQNRLARARG
ncbi:MAG: DNA alkylation repair protein [Ardenticatenaceae bacterium]|nr:DNA alkylation repair protein [Ardenticatenaceae bacterium]